MKMKIMMILMVMKKMKKKNKTDETYVMNNTKGEKFEITKKDIEDISCLKDLKN